MLGRNEACEGRLRCRGYLSFLGGNVLRACWSEATSRARVVGRNRITTRRFARKRCVSARFDLGVHGALIRNMLNMQYWTVVQRALAGRESGTKGRRIVYLF